MAVLRALTPRSSGRSRLLLAAVAWSSVGAGLALAGARWVLGWTAPAAAAGIGLALGLGWLKGRFVLGRRAEVNSRRILAAGDGRCIGGVFSWASWILVAAMVGLGWILRHSAVPRPWLGVGYVAVGTALIAASRPYWRSWRRAGRPAA